MHTEQGVHLDDIKTVWHPRQIYQYFQLSV